MTELSNPPDSPGDLPVVGDTPLTVIDTYPRPGLIVLGIVGELDLRTGSRGLSQDRCFRSDTPG